MKRIEALDQALNEQVRNLNDLGINPTLMKAYRTSLKVGNDHINFEEVIWDREIEPITSFLKANGISEITISSTFSSLISTLVLFEHNDFQLGGITEVTAGYNDFRTGTYAKVPALRLINI